MFRLQELKESRVFRLNVNHAVGNRHTKPLLDRSTLDFLTTHKIKIELAYTDTGVKNKPILILLHGNSSNKNVFDAHKQRYQDAYRIIAIDLLGHGKSTLISQFPGLSPAEKESLSKAFYNPLTMTALLTDLIESLAIEKAHLIGWSLGGHLAYGIGVLNPDLVASIVSIGSPPVKFSESGFKKGFNPWFVSTLVPEWVNHPKRYTLTEALEISRHAGLIKGGEVQLYVRAMIATDPLMRRHLFLKLQDYDAPRYDKSALDGEHFILNTHLPVCLLVGENDTGINPASIKEVVDEMRHSLSSVGVIEGGTHAIFFTHAEEYYENIDSFLNGVMVKNRNTLIS